MDIVPRLHSGSFDIEEWYKHKTPQFVRRLGTTPEHGQMVIAAPHVGYDAGTGPIAIEVSNSLGCPYVLGLGFRNRRRGYLYDVNRPTEVDAEDESKVHRETCAAMAIYRFYQDLLKTSVAERRVPMLVEIHGSRAHIADDGSEIPFQVIEVASYGITLDAIRCMKQVYEDVRQDLGLPWPMKMSVLEEDQKHTVLHNDEEVEVPFRWFGLETYRLGAFHPHNAKRVLQVELPQGARFEKDAGIVTADVLARVLTHAYSRCFNG